MINGHRCDILHFRVLLSDAQNPRGIGRLLSPSRCASVCPESGGRTTRPGTQPSTAQTESVTDVAGALFMVGSRRNWNISNHFGVHVETDPLVVARIPNVGISEVGKPSLSMITNKSNQSRIQTSKQSIKVQVRCLPVSLFGRLTMTPLLTAIAETTGKAHAVLWVGKDMMTKLIEHEVS